MDQSQAEGTSHGDQVPTHDEFVALRESWREGLARDLRLRESAVELQVEAERHNYTYTWEWGGVPIIRLPDDIVLFQEIVWTYRPERIVETGVARGGSVILSASLMRLTGIPPKVLGIDIEIFPHTHELLAEHPLAEGVTLLESDSTASLAAERTTQFLADCERAILVLDSNHTHEHVLAELRTLGPLLPVSSMILVADTLIEEFPAGHYANRPWDRGDNPWTATQQFVSERSDFDVATEWARRSLMSEFRDGILTRTGHQALE